MFEVRYFYYLLKAMDVDVSPFWKNKITASQLLHHFVIVWLILDNYGEACTWGLLFEVYNIYIFGRIWLKYYFKADTHAKKKA